jgi:hypothetical protein
MADNKTIEEANVNQFGEDFDLITGTGENVGDYIAILVLEAGEMDTITKAGTTISTNFPLPVGVVIGCSKGISSFTLASGIVLGFKRRNL